MFEDSKMVNSNTTMHYSTLHDSINSLCKTILPFSFKKRGLPAAERRLSKLQSDNLKWQQDSFHQMLNLMALHKEEILAETEVSVFRTHLLETLIVSPPEQEHPVILRDKLLFLHELLYAKCITEEKYHSSKRPLLQRLAVQGAEIEVRDVIVAGSKDPTQNSEEGWSVIDLKDEQWLLNKENSNPRNKSKQGKKQIEGAPSVFSFVSPYKNGKNWMEKKIMFDSPSLHLHSTPSKIPSSAKRQWMFEGFKKWKKNDSDDETAPLPLNERSDSEAYSASSHLLTRAPGEGQDAKLRKKKSHSDGLPSDFSTDKVLGDNIKKELSRIQTEPSNTNPNLKLSPWGDRHGDNVLDAVKKEFKDHVGEKENMYNNAKDKHNNTMQWTTFDDDENLHPNLFVHGDNSFRSSSINPFSHGCAENKWN